MNPCFVPWFRGLKTVDVVGGELQERRGAVVAIG